MMSQEDTKKRKGVLPIPPKSDFICSPAEVSKHRKVKLKSKPIEEDTVLVPCSYLGNMDPFVVVSFVVALVVIWLQSGMLCEILELYITAIAHKTLYYLCVPHTAAF